MISRGVAEGPVRFEWKLIEVYVCLSGFESVFILSCKLSIQRIPFINNFVSMQFFVRLIKNCQSM